MRAPNFKTNNFWVAALQSINVAPIEKHQYVSCHVSFLGWKWFLYIYIYVFVVAYIVGVSHLLSLFLKTSKTRCNLRSEFRASNMYPGQSLKWNTYGPRCSGNDVPFDLCLGTTARNILNCPYTTSAWPSARKMPVILVVPGTKCGTNDQRLVISLWLRSTAWWKVGSTFWGVSDPEKY